MTVDIIIPCYYQSEVIRPGLEKIAQQTILNDITVIMINDCSPNTKNEYLDLREEFSSKFKLKYTKTQVNSGPGVARQIGINMAQSDWIMFMDDDDELYDEHSIEKLLTLANLDNVISVSGQSMVLKVASGESEVHEPWLHHHGTIYNRKALLEEQIHFDERISYLEEDGAFARGVMYSSPKYQKLKLHEVVYIKRVAFDHVSLTMHLSDEAIFMGLLGLFTNNLQACMDSEQKEHLLYEYTEASIVIVNILFLLNFSPNLHLTTEQYGILLSFVAQYNALFKRMNSLVLPKVLYDNAINFNNKRFANKKYVFSYEVLTQYESSIFQWLTNIFNKIK